jgi:hypothetical protein
MSLNVPDGALFFLFGRPDEQSLEFAARKL